MIDECPNLLKILNEVLPLQKGEVIHQWATSMNQ